MLSRVFAEATPVVRHVTSAVFASASLATGYALARYTSTKATDHVATPTRPQAPSAIAQQLLHPESSFSMRRFPEFEIMGRVYVVTGGAQGLGLEIAARLVQAGAHVHVFDIKDVPSKEFLEQQELCGATAHGGSLTYHQVSVNIQNAEEVEAAFAKVADQHKRIDGLVAAAAIQFVKPITEYPAAEVQRMMDINFGGVWIAAKAAGKQMIKYNIPGSIVFVGSMSGIIANRDLYCSVYNASKAAVIQLGRSLAMEFGQAIKTPDGVKPIRVNVLSPGNIITPMVLQNFKDDPSLKAKWEGWNMMGRLSLPHEYTGAILFLLSDASSFMTGSNLVIDGGYTAW